MNFFTDFVVCKIAVGVPSVFLVNKKKYLFLEEDNNTVNPSAQFIIHIITLCDRRQG